MGTIHRPHPFQGEWNGQNFNDEEELILYDECPRCDEHSRNILGIDEEGLKALWEEMMRVEYNPENNDFYRSRAETRACAEMHRISVFLERVLNIDPRTLL